MTEDVDWLSVSSKSSPADSLRRIRFICGDQVDLFKALFLVLATHPSIQRDHLALAIKQSRTDVDDLTVDDIKALLVSIWNGGYPGFEAVLRNKRKKQKGNAGPLPWNAG